MSPRRLKFLLLGAALASSAATLPRAAFGPDGPEFQINTYTTNTQGDPAVAVGPSGDFVVVWESFGQDGSGFGVFARRYDRAGVPRGPEFQVNTYTTGNQYSPAVASAPSGGFVVVWESAGQDGSGFGISGQLYDNAGQRLGPELLVNTFTTGDQASVSVAVDAKGDFVVAWQSDEQDGSGYGVVGRRFSHSGSPKGAEFQVNTFTTGDQALSSVATTPSGSFVVVWQSSGQDGAGVGVFGRRFDGTGGSGPEFQVNTFTTGPQGHPAVAMTAAGNFMVVWKSFFQDESSWGIFGQRFDAAGAPQDEEFIVNTETYSGQVMGSLGVDGLGRFVVVWYSALQDGSDLGIFGQRFGDIGSPIGAEFQVNTFTTGEQNLPAVAMDPLGNFVVAWYSFAQDGSDLGIFGQRFYCAPTPAPVAGLNIEAVNGGAALRFTWADAVNATDYVLFTDSQPYGGFATQAGLGSSGDPGLMIETPPGDVQYFLMAGRNASCGLGWMR